MVKEIKIVWILSGMESGMNKERNFIQLLITYSMILLLPIIVIGLIVIFFYFNKLENEFQKLNTKTMETANVYMDGLVEEVHVISYKVTTDDSVHSFLTKTFQNNRERILTLKNMKDEINNALFNKDIVENVAVYSKINDTFIDRNTVFGRGEYYERYFAESAYTYDAFFEMLDQVGATPVWLVTEEYVVYCTDIKISGYTNRGVFMVTLKKKDMLQTVLDICNNLEMSYAVLHNGQDILLKNDSFDREIYEAVLGAESQGTQYRDYLMKKYASQSLGGVEFVYILERESLGGNVGQMVRGLVLTILLIFGLCIILAKREMKRIRDMYVNVLEENVSLESNLNRNVERLNRQLLLNALRGYEFLSFEKQSIHMKSGAIRVMILRVMESADLDDLVEKRAGLMEPNHLAEERDELTELEGLTEEGVELTQLVKNILHTEGIEQEFLFERNVGYIWVVGYEAQEKLDLAIQKLQKAVGSKESRKLHIGMSTQIQGLANLAEAYERAETAVRYCMLLHEEGGLVQYADIMELEKTKIYYTAEKEKQLLHSIRLGMQEEAQKCLEHIHRINFEERRLSRGAMRQLLVKMLNTIYELIDIVYDGAVDKYDEFGRVSRKVMQSDDMESAFEMIKTIALYTCSKCSGRREGELRERIISYLNDNFMDPDMSLGKMASDFEMSYFHLSRLFNEYMQMNFATYLMGIRLDYSKELLDTSKYSVDQVATKAGFIQTNSFVRAFKKYYGMTPEKYREEN